MQISGKPLLAGLGFLQQPQSGSNQQINPQLQAKANAAAPLRSGQAANPRPVQARAQAPAAAPTARLAGAQNLEQAVQALAEQGRLPPRGSLIDLSA